jgi:hypothetical protein
VDHHHSAYNITNRTTFNPKVPLDQHSFNKNSDVEPAKADRQTTSLEIEVYVKEHITLIFDIVSSLLLVVNLRYLSKGLVRSESKQHLAHDGAAVFVNWGRGGSRRVGRHAHEVVDTSLTSDCRSVTAALVLASLQGMINSNGGFMCKTHRLLYWVAICF